MNQLATRIALYYATAATLTLFGLFSAGYVLLQNSLSRALDLLNKGQFQQIALRLGPEHGSLSEPYIEMRMRELSDMSSTLFYIEVQDKAGESFFRSPNLSTSLFPEGERDQSFEVTLNQTDTLRVGVFDMSPFQVAVGTPMRPVESAMRTYLRIGLALLVLMLVLSLLIGLGLANVLLTPIRLIRDTANQITSTNLQGRVPLDKHRDELSDLARLFNAMLDRLEASFREVQRFAADASHELKTPLSVVRLQAEKLLVNQSLPPEHREPISDMLLEIARLNRIIEDMLFLSRAEAQAIPLEFKLIDTRHFIESFAADGQILAEHHGLNLKIDIQTEIDIEMEPELMRQVLFNLLINAIHVSQEGASIWIRSELIENRWRMEVLDEGPGLSENDRAKLFARFSRINAKQSNWSSSGLGLAICKSIVDLHEGTLEAHPGLDGKGLSMQVRLQRGRRTDRAA